MIKTTRGTYDMNLLTENPIAKESRFCPVCKGSGEGQVDGSTCYTCKGSGDARDYELEADKEAEAADHCNDARLLEDI